MITLWAYLVSIAVVFVMDTFRRRTFFLIGCGGLLVVLISWTIASERLVVYGSLAAGRFVIACIFLYQAFYTLAWLNLVVTYPLELVTYQMRAKALAYVLLVIYVSQIFGNYATRLRWRISAGSFIPIFVFGLRWCGQLFISSLWKLRDLL